MAEVLTNIQSLLLLKHKNSWSGKLIQIKVQWLSEITGNNKLNCSLSSYLIDNIKGMLPIDCFSGSGEVSHTGVAFCEKNGIDTSDSEAMKIYIWRCQYTKKTMTQEQLKSALSMCDKMQSISVSDEPF